MIVFAQARSQAQINPVGGLIRDTFEFLSVDKSLQKVDRMVVESLPGRGYVTGNAAQKMTGKIAHLNPR